MPGLSALCGHSFLSIPNGESNACSHLYKHASSTLGTREIGSLQPNLDATLLASPSTLSRDRAGRTHQYHQPTACVIHQPPCTRGRRGTNAVSFLAKPLDVCPSPDMRSSAAAAAPTLAPHTPKRSHQGFGTWPRCLWDQ